MEDTTLIRKLLTYNECDGLFRWAEDRSRLIKKGEVAGTVNGCGYIKIKINGKQYLGHRLAWLMTYGEWPNGVIDHKNHNRKDNRICNLREATKSTNSHNARKPINNTSGVKGVHWCKRKNAWIAKVQLMGKITEAGKFSSLSEAASAVMALRIRLHGEFANHG